MSNLPLKFEREAKETPRHWIIGTDGNGFKLIYIGP